jgi:hypothetical protein
LARGGPSRSQLAKAGKIGFLVDPSRPGLVRAGRGRSKAVQVRQSQANTGPTWPHPTKVGQKWSYRFVGGSKPVKAGHNLDNWPKPVKTGQSWPAVVKPCQNWPKVGRSWPKPVRAGKSRSELAKAGKSPSSWSKLVKTGPIAFQSWSDLAR